MTKLLVFFTSSYPNTAGEVFVENEIKFLEKAFNKILIICAEDKQSGAERYIPENAEVVFFNDRITTWQKIISLRFLFKKIFRDEIKYSTRVLNIKFKLIHIKVLLIDLFRADLLRKFTNKQLKQQAQYSQIHVYSYWSDYRAVACALLKIQHPEFKSYARNHRWDLYFYANTPPYLSLRKFIFDHLDAVFCIADDGANYIKNVLNFPNTNIRTAKLGTFNPHQELNPYVERGQFTIVSCSNLLPVKRVHLIIEALSQITDQQIHWIHFGDGILKVQLAELAKKLLIQGNIAYEFKGSVSNSQILSYYREHQVDLFINVSESEGIPVSIMEAMSYGIPVLATDVGGNREIVLNTINGILLNINDNSEEIAHAIHSFLKTNFETIMKMRTITFRVWKENYNAEANYNRFVNEVTSL